MIQRFTERIRGRRRVVSRAMVDRVTQTLFPGRMERLEKVIGILEQAWFEGPFMLSSTSLVRQLAEVDDRLIDLIMRQRGYQLLTPSGRLQFNETDRRREVLQAWYWYYYDVQSERAVQMWTDFGFGQKLQVVPRDEALAQVWLEFWGDRLNAPLLKERKLHRLSNQLILDGELFFAFNIATVDGSVTLRRIPTDEVSEIIYEGHDRDIPLFYVRTEDTGSVYYPDWQATEEQLSTVEIPAGASRADVAGAGLTDQQVQDNPQTDVVVLHAAFKEINGRGWPFFTRVHAWAKAYKEFLEDRATVAKAVATFVDEIIHKTGSRGGQSIQDVLDSSFRTSGWGAETNPMGPAGSPLIHNEAIDVRRRPLTTGAGDAQVDGMTLLGQVSSGTGAPLHWLGRPDAMQNRAVARETERPWIEQMERYQLFWADVFQDMVEIVGRAKEKYPANRDERRFSTYEADITLESPYFVLVDEVAALMGQIAGAAEKGVLDAEVAGRALDRLTELSLTAFGVRDPATILHPPEEEAEEEEEGEEVGLMEMIRVVRENVEASPELAENAGAWALLELWEDIATGGDGAAD